MAIEALLRDLRYSVRVLLKSRVFTATAVTTLALCIGANTAIFTVVDRVLLRPLPYPRPDRLAMVVRHYSEGGRVVETDVSQAGATWVALREHATTLDVAALSDLGQGVNLVAGTDAEYVNQQRVSAGYFDVLGVAPLVGREFTAEEDLVKGPAVAVLSHALWQHAFHGDPAIVGRSITLRGEPHTVVGIMPASFRSSLAADVWTPLRPSPTGEGGGENYEIIARLKDGVTWGSADGQASSVTASVVRERYGKSRYTVTMGLLPLQRGLADQTRQPLMILWAAVGVVLLLGCVNVAGLLLARGALRAPEMAMRVALGGGRGAIIRQLLTESVVLAVAGGLAGLAIGYLTSQLCASLLEDAFGVTGTGALDARALAATSSVALCTSVVFGLLPAWQATRIDLRQTLVESGGTSVAGAARSWPRRAMVVAEVALGVVLLVGAGLLIRNLDRLLRQPAGFDGGNVMTATLSLQDARYRHGERVGQLFERTLARMREVPGVQAAAVALTLPYERPLNNGFRLTGSDAAPQMLHLTYVTPDYFEALRIPILQGRAFAPSDVAASEAVVVVNQAFVRRHLSDRDPVGRQITMGGTPRRIVGVAGDVQQKVSFGNYGPVGAPPAGYVPAAQMSGGFFTQVHTWFSPSWIVRLSGPQEGIVGQMQRAVKSVDPLLPFAKFRTLDDVRGRAVATQRAQATLLGALAGLALLLAAVGLYGLVANAVAERTRELGIRVALGATPARALGAAAMPGLALGSCGVVVGVGIARASARVMTTLAWGVPVGDPLTFVVAAATVLAVSIVATLLPALRVLRLNPVGALRQS